MSSIFHDDCGWRYFYLFNLIFATEIKTKKLIAKNVYSERNTPRTREIEFYAARVLIIIINDFHVKSYLSMLKSLRPSRVLFAFNGFNKNRLKFLLLLIYNRLLSALAQFNIQVTTIHICFPAILLDRSIFILSV